MNALWLLSGLLLPPLATTGERLDRGAIAVTSSQSTLISWRKFPEDPAELGFNVYRLEKGNRPQKLNIQPIVGASCFNDNFSSSAQYQVKPVQNGKEGKALPVMMRRDGQRLPYLSIPLQQIPGYIANDASVGDLDGDGVYELLVHRTGRAKDNSQKGETDPPLLEAYRLDGTFLWRINLGKNIREGAHYTQFLVYDFDGDGRAEVACKTADGTTDARGKIIGDPKANHRNADGYILRGPEYLTVFDGRRGTIRDTVKYEVPRHPTKEDPTSEEMNAVWGDGYGNRCDRFLAAAAYLDGSRPSLIFARGYYTRTCLAAWDFKNGKLVKRWVFDSRNEPAFGGNGNHNLTVADVDSDGRDEIVYGSMTVDDNGKGLYSTGLGHGDAIHVSDLDPNHPGLEVYAIHEHSRKQIGVTFRDAKTGTILWQKPSPDVGRGVAIDIDPRYAGDECWSSMTETDDGLWSATGQVIAQKKPKSCNFAVYWDGDPLREILDANLITKWNWDTSSEQVLLEGVGCVSNNGTKSTPVLSGDLLGDWREEVIWRTEDGKELRIYSTPIPTEIGLPTLVSDRQYRMALAWQNVGYNQPPHVSYNLFRRATGR